MRKSLKHANERYAYKNPQLLLYIMLKCLT